MIALLDDDSQRPKIIATVTKIDQYTWKRPIMFESSSILSLRRCQFQVEKQKKKDLKLFWKTRASLKYRLILWSFDGEENVYSFVFQRQIHWMHITWEERRQYPKWFSGVHDTFFVKSFFAASFDNSSLFYLSSYLVWESLIERATWRKIMIMPCL